MSLLGVSVSSSLVLQAGGKGFLFAQESLLRNSRGGGLSVAVLAYISC
jgi:aspartate oxidase